MDGGIHTISVDAGAHDGDLVFPGEERLVLGFADLHTHPGIEESFDRRLIWGRALEGTAPVDPNILPLPAPCPVETHRGRTGTPTERSAHGLILPLLNDQEGFVHAPIVRPDGVSLSGWPNARDVIHQGMHVNSIRRAYEGGLRLMFASVTDNQVLAQLLQGPSNPSLSRAREAYEEESALAQIQRIEDLVQSQSSWMEIALSPTDARRIIADENKLAVVISLEMDALSHDSMVRLIRDHGARHVFPVHLVDNRNGGTAVTGEIFNAASAYMSEIYGERYSFMQLRSSPEVRRRLSRPIYGRTQDGLPVFGTLGPIELPWYEDLGYEDTCHCVSNFSGQTEYLQEGHQNVRGLQLAGTTLVNELLRGIERPAGERIPVMVDLSHMSWQTAADVVARAQEMGNIPLMASHGAVAVAGEPTSGERDLSPFAAQYVAEHGGVIGLGTSFVGEARLLAWNEAHPLARLSSSPPGTQPERICALTSGAASDCETVIALPRAEAPAGSSVTSLRVEVAGTGWCSAANPVIAEVSVAPTGQRCDNASGMVIHRAALSPSDSGCAATVSLRSSLRTSVGGTTTPGMCSGGTGGTFDISQVCEVSLHEIDSVCDIGNGAFDLGVGLVSVYAVGASEENSLVSSRRVGSLSRGNGSVALFRRGWSNADLALPVISIGVHLADGIPGPSLLSGGYELCARLRVSEPSGCVPAALAPQVRGGCAVGSVSMNHLGAVSNENVLLRAFVPLPATVHATDLCGVDFVLAGQGRVVDAEFSSIELSVLEDPVVAWAESYRRALRTYWPDGYPLGMIALGTDFNGLATQIPVSTTSPTVVRSEAFGWRTQALERMTVGDSDGPELRLEDRGIATYGMLADFVARLGSVRDASLPRSQRIDVQDSLLLSAERVIRYWEAVERSTRRETAP